MIRRSIQNMNAYVPGEQPADERVIKLNTNENPYPPSPAVISAMKSFSENRLRLYPDPTAGDLCARIAELHSCEPSMVMAGNGSDELLALCTRAFVENEGSIGFFDPSYSLYHSLSDIRGVEKVPTALGPGFEWTEPASCSLFFLTRPNAPTGVLYPGSTVRDFCSRFNGVVVIDEAYVDFADDDCVDLALEMNNVIVLRTMSKSFSLASLRVGYALGHPTLIEAMIKIKDSYNLNGISQVLAIAALSDIEHMRKNADMIKTTRARLENELKKMGYGVTPSNGNFIWVLPREPAAKVFRHLRDSLILTRYFPGERTGDHLRITIGTDSEIDILLDALGKCNQGDNR